MTGFVVGNTVHGFNFLGPRGATRTIAEATVYPTEAAARKVARRTWGSRAWVMSTAAAAAHL